MRWKLFSLLLLLIFACDVKEYPQGKQLYTHLCANCHMDNGQGLAGLIPPLKNADYLDNPRQVVCIIKYGLQDTILVNGKVYDGEMPANTDLNPVQIANILNYINTAWNNNKPFTPLDSVHHWLNDCPNK